MRKYGVTKRRRVKQTRKQNKKRRQTGGGCTRVKKINKNCFLNKCINYSNAKTAKDFEPTTQIECDGWIKHWDPEANAYYYNNDERREAVWEKPSIYSEIYSKTGSSSKSK